MRYLILMTCLTLVPAQQQPPATTTTSSAEPINSSSVDCFTSSSVVGAVLGTFFATSIVLGSIFFILWWIYCRRRRSSLSGKKRNLQLLRVRMYPSSIIQGQPTFFGCAHFKIRLLSLLLSLLFYSFRLTKTLIRHSKRHQYFVFSQLPRMRLVIHSAFQV